MQRIAEAELMDDEELAAGYAAMDFSASNQWFVDQVTAILTPHVRRVVDLGCGPGDMLIRMIARRPWLQITAVDGAAAMIRIARQAIHAAGLGAHVRFKHGRIPRIALASGSFDAILSKDLLHHLPDPCDLWHEARRLGRAGARVCVMDLHRPATPAEAARIVDESDGLPDALKRDFYNSLCAAFTVDEIETQIRHARLPLRVERVSQRHVLVTGCLN